MATRAGSFAVMGYSFEDQVSARASRDTSVTVPHSVLVIQFTLPTLLLCTGKLLGAQVNITMYPNTFATGTRLRPQVVGNEACSRVPAGE